MTELDQYQQRLGAALERAWRPTSPRPRRPGRVGLAVVLLCIALATAAVAIGAVLAGGGSDSAPTRLVADRTAIDFYALGRTPPLLPGALPPRMATLLTQGAKNMHATLDLSEVHRGRAQHGVTPYLVATYEGEVCELFQHGGGAIWAMSCGDPAHLQQGLVFDDPGGSVKYVGFRADGVSSIRAGDGTIVPVIDNVFVIEQPIVPTARRHRTRAGVTGRLRSAK